MDNKILLQADVQNGVYITSQESGGADMLDENTFFRSLSGLGTGEAICAYVTKEMYARIEGEFGIH